MIAIVASGCGAARDATGPAPASPPEREARGAELAAIAFDELRSSGVELSSRDARVMRDVIDTGLRRFERDDPRGVRWEQAKHGWRQLLRESRRASDEPDEDPLSVNEPKRAQGLTAAMGGEGCRFWPFCV